MTEAGWFSGVLPTYNRLSALKANLPNLLNLEGLATLIVVVDASTDGTEAFLATLSHPLLKVLTNSKNQGSQSSRMRGIREANTPWILMLDDDCSYPRDYAAILRADAVKIDADIMGAPWVHAHDAFAIAAVRRQKGLAIFNMDTPHGAFPRIPMRTPFLGPSVLAKSEVFCHLAYSDRYKVNAWREETSLFLDAEIMGLVCGVSPNTFSYQSVQYSGGQRRARLPYEYWIVRNNWVFLKRYSGYLRRNHGALPALMEQARFLVRRGGWLVSGWVKARVRAGAGRVGARNSV